MERRALLLVDVQNDFFEGGTLAVPGASGIVPVINKLRTRKWDVTLLAVDWHPVNHVSFSNNNPGHAPFTLLQLNTGPQVMWPGHCVQDSAGADWHPDLHLEATDVVVPAGFNAMSDSYSAFRDNDNKNSNSLRDIVRQQRITQVYVCGLATDYCVLYTALDAKILTSAQVFLVSDACAGLSPEGIADAYSKMRYEGIEILESSDPRIAKLPRKLPPLTDCPSRTSPQESRDAYLLECAMRLDVSGVRMALGVGADKHARPLPQGRNVLHMVAATNVRHKRWHSLLSSEGGALDEAGSDTDDSSASPVPRGGAGMGYSRSLSKLSHGSGGRTSRHSSKTHMRNELARSKATGYVLQIMRMVITYGASVAEEAAEEESEVSRYVNSRTDSDSPNAGGETALMLASASGNAEAVRLLVDYGADVDASENREGLTALMFACSAKWTEVVSVLVHARANMLMATYYKKTALMFAAAAIETVQMRRDAQATAAAAKETQEATPYTSVKSMRSLRRGGSTRKGLPTKGSMPSFTASTRSLAFTVQVDADRSGDDIPSASDDSADEELAVDGDSTRRRTPPAIKAAVRTVMALLSGVPREEIFSLLRHKDVAGWNALHFMAKTGALAAVPWPALFGGIPMEDDKALRAKTVTDNHNILHLAVWNGQAKSILYLAPPQASLSQHKSKRFLPWKARVDPNERGGRDGNSALDLAYQVNDHVCSTLILRAGGHALRSDGALSTEALERAILHFDSGAASSLLMFEQNGVTNEAHAIKIMQLVQKKSTCTFAWAGYNNASPQHMSHCDVCNADVCLVCASRCHNHGEGKLPKTLGFQDSPVYCKCSRRTCRCTGEGVEGEEDIRKYDPWCVVTDDTRCSYDGNQLVLKASDAASVIASLSAADEEEDSEVDALVRAAEAAAARSRHSSVVKSRPSSSGFLESGFSDSKEAPRAAVPSKPNVPVADSRLVKQIAKTLHAVWVMFKLFSGWRYHPDTADDEAQLSPDLTTFDKLDDDSKDRYLDDALWTLRCILSLGFTMELPAVRKSAESAVTHMPLAEAFTSVDKEPRPKSLSRRLGAKEFTLCLLIAEQQHLQWSRDMLEEGYKYGADSAGASESAPDAPGTPVAAAVATPTAASTTSGGAGAADESRTHPDLKPFLQLAKNDIAQRTYQYEMVLQVLYSMGVAIKMTDHRHVNKFLNQIVLKKARAAARRQEETARLKFLRGHFWGAMLLRAGRTGSTDLAFTVMEVRGVSPNPDVNYRSVTTGQTPLHLASRNGHVQLVRRLISYSAKLEYKDVQGLTPLATASFSNHKNVCKALLKAGAAPLTDDAFGLSPMHHAAYFGIVGSGRLFAKHLVRLRNSGELMMMKEAQLAAATKVANQAAANRWQLAKKALKPSLLVKKLGAGKLAAAKKPVGPDVSTPEGRRQVAINTMRSRLAKFSADEKRELVMAEGATASLSIVLRELHANPMPLQYVALGVAKVKSALSSRCGRERRLATCRALCCGSTRCSGVCVGREKTAAELERSAKIKRRKEFEHLGAGGDCRYHPVALAVMARQPEALQLLLKHDADPTRPDATGLSPFHRALRAHAAARFLRKEASAIVKELTAKRASEMEEEEDALSDELAGPASPSGGDAAALLMSAMAKSAGGGAKAPSAVASAVVVVSGGKLGDSKVTPAEAGSSMEGPKSPKKPQPRRNSRDDAVEAKAAADKKPIIAAAEGKPTAVAGKRGSLTVQIKGMVRRHSSSSQGKSPRGMTALKAKQLMQKAKHVERRYAKLQKEQHKIVGILNTAPQVKRERRVVAVQTVAARVVAFMAILSMLLIVSPFAYDYDMKALTSSAADVRNGIQSSFGDVANVPQWWNWVDKTLLGAPDDWFSLSSWGLGSDAMRGRNATIVQTNPDGTLSAMDDAVVGPIQVTLKSWVVPGQLPGGSVEQSVACQVDKVLMGSLGLCGGLGVVSTSRAAAAGTLELTSTVSVLRGSPEDMRRDARALAAAVVPGALKSVTFEMTLYDAIRNLFVGVTFGIDASGDGRAPGTATTFASATAVLLFHERLPPSAVFEVVIVAVQVLQILGILYRVRGMQWKVGEYFRRRENLFDLVLMVVLGSMSFLGFVMRIEADSIREQISEYSGLAPSAIAGAQVSDLLNAGKATSYGASIVDVLKVANKMQILGDVLAVGLLMAGARLITFLTMLPGLGPMLVAVTATFKHSSVQLYVVLLVIILFIFGMAFNVSVGTEAANFNTLPSAVVSLFKMALFGPQDNPTRTFTSLLFVGFILFLGVVLMNLFIGVVTDVYPRAKRRSEADWEDLVTDMMEARFDLQTRLAKKVRRMRTAMLFPVQTRSEATSPSGRAAHWIKMRHSSSAAEPEVKVGGFSNLKGSPRGGKVATVTIKDWEGFSSEESGAGSSDSDGNTSAEEGGDGKSGSDSE